jgi:hypothetical protein
MQLAHIRAAHARHRRLRLTKAALISRRPNYDVCWKDGTLPSSGRGYGTEQKATGSGETHRSGDRSSGQSDQPDPGHYLRLAKAPFRLPLNLQENGRSAD